MTLIHRERPAMSRVSLGARWPAQNPAPSPKSNRVGSSKHHVVGIWTEKAYMPPHSAFNAAAAAMPAVSVRKMREPIDNASAPRSIALSSSCAV